MNFVSRGLTRLDYSPVSAIGDAASRFAPTVEGFQIEPSRRFRLDLRPEIRAHVLIVEPAHQSAEFYANQYTTSRDREISRHSGDGDEGCTDPKQEPDRGRTTA